MFLAQILVEGVDEEYLSFPLNFKTFENMNKKLWPNRVICKIIPSLASTLDKLLYKLDGRK